MVRLIEITGVDAGQATRLASRLCPGCEVLDLVEVQPATPEEDVKNLLTRLKASVPPPVRRDQRIGA